MAMTKKERFANFLANKPVDRAPVAFFHHFCGPTEWFRGLESEEIFMKNVNGHRIAREKFDPDVIKIMNDSLMIMPVDVSMVECAADLRKITAPVYGSPYFEKTRELTEKTKAIYADSDAPVYATGFSPAMVLRMAVNGPVSGPGKSKIVQYLEEDPEAVEAALDIVSASIIALNEMLIRECGVDGIYFSVNNQAHAIPDELFARHFAPYDIKVLAAANELSGMNLLHICGYHGLSNNLELFRDYPAAAYNIAVYAEGVSLRDGRKLFGGKPVFGGFAQDGTIYTGTPEEVRKATWDILDECGQTGIMIGDDCTVPNDIDDDRFNWVRRACEEYAEAHG